MMTKLVKPFLFVFLSFLIIFSCVKEEAESTTSIEERILKAYIEVNHGDIKPTASGMYIVDSLPGTGASITDSAYAYVRYTTKTLNRNYSDWTYESIAKQLGTYQAKSFYGTYVWAMGRNALQNGREEILGMMKIGGKITAILPPWLLDEELELYVASGESYVNQIYDIELDTFVVNIENYEIEQLESYASKHYGGLDSLKKGFYFKEYSGEFGNDTIPDETSLNIKYIGRRLDGTVFDTNIKDSSIKYGIFTNEGAPNEKEMKFIYMKDYEQAKKENEYTEGFTLAITEMGGYKDKCITFFDSSYGHGSLGSPRSLDKNLSVPGYYPIFFEIWIDDEPDND